jgi:hypothetical protein
MKALSTSLGMASLAKDTVYQQHATGETGKV